MLVVCNQAGRIEHTNAALCELLGRNEVQLRGTWLDQLLANVVNRAIH